MYRRPFLGLVCGLAATWLTREFSFIHNEVSTDSRWILRTSKGVMRRLGFFILLSLAAQKKEKIFTNRRFTCRRFRATGSRKSSGHTSCWSQKRQTACLFSSESIMKRKQWLSSWTRYHIKIHYCSNHWSRCKVNCGTLLEQDIISYCTIAVIINRVFNFKNSHVM